MTGIIASQFASGVPLMSPVHRIEVVLSADGKLLLDHLPFRAGQTVEVVVLPVDRPASSQGRTIE